jgi:hypothetical protein
MKIFFAKRTFSKHVLKWWINLQQQHIASGDEPCRTWNGMKVVLQRRFDHPHEHPIPKINKVAWLLRNILFAGLTPSMQQAIAIKPAMKKVAVGARNLHGPPQQVLPLSSKSNDNMNNIEYDISAGTKLKQCSS